MPARHVGTLTSLPRLRLPSPSVTVVPIPSIVDWHARLLAARRKANESQDQGWDLMFGSSSTAMLVRMGSFDEVSARRGFFFTEKGVALLSRSSRLRFAEFSVLGRGISQK